MNKPNKKSHKESFYSEKNQYFLSGKDEKLSSKNSGYSKNEEAIIETLATIIFEQFLITCNKK